MRSRKVLIDGLEQKANRSKSDKGSRAASHALYYTANEIYYTDLKEKYCSDRDAKKASPEGMREQARAVIIQEFSKRISATDQQILDLIKKFKNEVVYAILDDLGLISQPKKILSVAQIKSVILAYEDHIRLIEDVCKMLPPKTASNYSQYELFFSELMQKNYLFAHFAPKRALTRNSPNLSFVPKRELPYIKQLFEENGLIGSKFYERYCVSFLAKIESQKLDTYSLQPEKFETYFTPEKIEERQSLFIDYEMSLDDLTQDKINATHDFIDDIVCLIVSEEKETQEPIKSLIKKFRIHVNVLKDIESKMDFKGENVVETLKAEIKSGLSTLSANATDLSPLTSS